MELKPEEFSKFAKALKTYYPSSENLMPNQQAINLWYEELKDINYKLLATALRRYVQTERFPPTIADLRRIAHDIVAPSSDWGSGWEITVKAIRHYGNYRPAEGLQAIKEQDELAYKVVRRMGGFIELCNSTNAQADRANFRLIYEELKLKERKEGVISEQLRTVIGRIERKELEETK